MSRVIVVGAGIAGLCIAFRLRASHEVSVFERAASPGGKIRSELVDGCTFDWGPNGFLSSASELREIVDEAGLEHALTEADPAASKRYIFWHGALRELPAKPPQAMSTSLLSPAGKVRALGDLIVRSRLDGADDESVYAFAQRRFGREVAERIVAPALLGISGGDAATASLAAMFPRLPDFEREHGSVIRGMMRARRTPGRLTGFGAAGMQRLSDGLAARLREPVRFDCAVERIEPRPGGWRVAFADGELDADAVVLATPAYIAAGIVEGWDSALAAELRRITYAPMRVAGIAFGTADVPAPLDGFGFLAARGQGVRILGAVYTSTIFPQQAPPDTAYLRVFLGGAADPEAAAVGVDDARAIVREDLAATLGIRAEPIAYHERIWRHAIPQYTLGHRARLRAIDDRLAERRGLFLAGNAYRGLGVGDVVRDAIAVANAMTTA